MSKNKLKNRFVTKKYSGLILYPIMLSILNYSGYATNVEIFETNNIQQIKEVVKPKRIKGKKKKPTPFSTILTIRLNALTTNLSTKFETLNKTPLNYSIKSTKLLSIILVNISMLLTGFIFIKNIQWEYILISQITNLILSYHIYDAIYKFMFHFNIPIKDTFIRILFNCVLSLFILAIYSIIFFIFYYKNMYDVNKTDNGVAIHNEQIKNEKIEQMMQFRFKHKIATIFINIVIFAKLIGLNYLTSYWMIYSSYVNGYRQTIKITLNKFEQLLSEGIFFKPISYDRSQQGVTLFLFADKVGQHYMLSIMRSKEVDIFDQYEFYKEFRLHNQSWATIFTIQFFVDIIKGAILIAVFYMCIEFCIDYLRNLLGWYKGVIIIDFEKITKIDTTDINELAMSTAKLDKDIKNTRLLSYWYDQNIKEMPKFQIDAYYTSLVPTNDEVHNTVENLLNQATNIARAFFFAEVDLANAYLMNFQSLILEGSSGTGKSELMVLKRQIISELALYVLELKKNNILQQNASLKFDIIVGFKPDSLKHLVQFLQFMQNKKEYKERKKSFCFILDETPVLSVDKTLIGQLINIVKGNSNAITDLIGSLFRDTQTDRYTIHSKLNIEAENLPELFNTNYEQIKTLSGTHFQQKNIKISQNKGHFIITTNYAISNKFKPLDERLKIIHCARDISFAKTEKYFYVEKQDSFPVIKEITKKHYITDEDIENFIKNTPLDEQLSKNIIIIAETLLKAINDVQRSARLKIPAIPIREMNTGDVAINPKVLTPYLYSFATSSSIEMCVYATTISEFIKALEILKSTKDMQKQNVAKILIRILLMSCQSEYGAKKIINQLKTPLEIKERMKINEEGKSLEFIAKQFCKNLEKNFGISNPNDTITAFELDKNEITFATEAIAQKTVQLLFLRYFIKLIFVQEKKKKNFEINDFIEAEKRLLISK